MTQVLQQRGPTAPLATYTDFTSPLDRIDPDGVNLSAEKRLFKWDLQTSARKLLGSSHRIGTCHRVKAPVFQNQEVAVYRKEKTRHTYYGGLMTCANAWACPICASKIAERRRQELDGAINLHAKQGGGIYHMLITLPHKRSNTVTEVVEALLKSFNGLTSGKRALKALVPSYLGIVRCLEVTYGDNGWHPHLHVLVFTGQKLTEAEKVATESRIWGRWYALALKTGLGTASRQAFSFGEAQRGQKEQKFTLDPGAGDFDRVAEYVSKFGADREIEKARESGQVVEVILRRRTWGAADEMTRAHLKNSKFGASPWALLSAYTLNPETDTGKKAGALWKMFVQAFQGKHQLAWSRDLRKHFGLQAEQTDEQLAEKVEAEDARIASIPDEDWKVIRSRNLRGLVLEILREGTYDQVIQLLRLAGRPRRVDPLTGTDSPTVEGGGTGLRGFAPG